MRVPLVRPYWQRLWGYSTRKITLCASAKLTVFAGGTLRWYHSLLR